MTTPTIEEEICALVNAEPMIQSMLYDLNLLPEQTLDDITRWPYTVSAVMHMEPLIAELHNMVEMFSGTDESSGQHEAVSSARRVLRQ